MEKRHMGVDCLNGDKATHHYNIHNNLCCFRLMHLRTGGMIVAYVEFMLLTSLISYMAARSVVQGYSHSLIVLGILCAMQAFFACSLVWGIKRERLEFLLISLASVGLRLLFVVTYLFAIAAAHIVRIRDGSFLEQNVILNTILSVIFIIVYGFCISVITRLHAYYSKLHIVILSDNAKKRRCSSCSTDMYYMKHLTNQYTTSVLQEVDTGEMIARRLSAAEQCTLINTKERLKNSAVDNVLYENSEDSENE